LVSEIELVDGPTLAVTIRKAAGEKCDRCWNYTIDVGTDERYPGACLRCVTSLDERDLA
jgi:isoleucyl-tRNA synthetase